MPIKDELATRVSRIESALDVLSPLWRQRAAAASPSTFDKPGGGATAVIDRLVDLARAYQTEAAQRGERLTYPEAVSRIIEMPQHEALWRQYVARVRK